MSFVLNAILVLSIICPPIYQDDFNREKEPDVTPVDFWWKQDSFQCLIGSLERVNIGYHVIQSERGFESAKSLLKNAATLKSMTIKSCQERIKRFWICYVAYQGFLYRLN